MIKPGLVSITFRSLSVREIVELAARGGVKAIEWGGDVHCPHGRTAIAAEAGEVTRQAGLSVSAYGSYYRLGHQGDEKVPDFQAVLDSARALGAPRIRVWAGRRSPSEADPDYRRLVAEDARRVAGLAAESGIEVVTEYHGNTLTETMESYGDFAVRAAHGNLFTYWQPPRSGDPSYCTDSLRQVLPVLRGLHVFHWTLDRGKRQRRPLAEGAGEWLPWLATVYRAGLPVDALIEFVRDDRPGQFVEDARTLIGWINQVVTADGNPEGV